MSLEPLLSASPAVQIHVVGAISAMLIGPFALWRQKRDRWHKLAGYVFLTGFIILVASSFFITTIRMIGPFSPIHLLSLWSAFAIWQGWRHIRARRIDAHRRTMRGLYYQALGVALIFTFLPGRVMNKVVFGEAGELGAKLVIGFGVPLLTLIIIGPWLKAHFFPSLRKSEKL